MTSTRWFGLAAGLLTVLAVPAAARAQTSAQRTPTFSRDVAPIFQRSCQNCHRPESIAPMSLLTYEDARPWARSIKQKVAARDMPPWFIDKTIGIQKYKADMSLSDDQIAKIVKWVDRPPGLPQSSPEPEPVIAQPAPKGAVGGDLDDDIPF